MYSNCGDNHEFVPHPNRTDNACLLCTRKYGAERQRLTQKRIREMLNEFKLSKGCADCGYKAHVAALQFDHIIPVKREGKWMTPKTKKEAINLMNDPNIQVLCANCHAIKTRENGDYKAREVN